MRIFFSSSWILCTSFKQFNTFLLLFKCQKVYFKWFGACLVFSWYLTFFFCIFKLLWRNSSFYFYFVAEIWSIIFTLHHETVLYGYNVWTEATNSFIFQNIIRKKKTKKKESYSLGCTRNTKNTPIYCTIRKEKWKLWTIRRINGWITDRWGMRSAFLTNKTKSGKRDSPALHHQLAKRLPSITETNWNSVASTKSYTEKRVIQ